jgi:WD40 repeat protein
MTDVESLSPYKGLTPFEDSDLDVLFFFGRERERELLEANLMASRLTVLYGDTGVGKSSILRAGVAHHLRGLARTNVEEHGEPGLAVVVFDAWRDDPQAALRDAVAQAVRDALGGSLHAPDDPGSLTDTLWMWQQALAGDVYVILDQAEEYFLYHGGEEGAGTFAADFPAIVNSADLRVNFLLAIREDALAKLDVFRAQIPNVLGNYLRLEHLEPRAARAAIVEPISQYNRMVDETDTVDIEAALVDAVLDQLVAGKVDVGQAGRGAVEGGDGVARIETPYLQLVMQRLWDEEQGAGKRTLRLETLHRLGGAERIVHEHVDGALADLTAGEKDVAARMFDHLVTPSGTKIAHDAGDLAKYARAGEGQILPVLAKLGNERILRSVAGNGADGSRYELFHDVLAEPVLAWKTAHETNSELDRQRAEAEKRHRRLLGLVALAIVALLVMAGVTVFALTQRTRARSDAGLARARELAAVATAEVQTNPEQSLSIALQAAELRRTAQSEDALRASLLASHLLHVLPAGRGSVRAAAFSPDGSRVVTASADGGARVFDAATGALLRVLTSAGPVTSVSYSPDGTLVATTSVDRTARLWPADGRAAVRVLRHPVGVRAGSFSPDGRMLVTVGEDGRARIWQIRSGRLLRVLNQPGDIRTAAFNHDGSLVLTVGGDRFARVFDVDTGRLLHRLPQRGQVLSAVFGPGGKLVVTTSEDRTARLWNARTGAFLGELGGHSGRVLGASISPRGNLVMTVSTDGYARIWTIVGPKLLATLFGHQNYVLNGGFSPDGFWVVTASADRTARVWNVQSGDPRAIFAGDTESVTSAAFSPDSRTVLTTSDDGTARLWDSTIEPELGVLARLPGPVVNVSLDSPGRFLVAGGPGRDVFVIRRDTGLRVRRLRETGPVTGVAIDTPGVLVATASGDHVTLWRRDSDAPIRVLRQTVAPTSLAISPDRGTIAIGSGDGSVRLVDVHGHLLRLMRNGSSAVPRVAFSPDGLRLVAASRDGSARIWAVGTGRLEHVLRGHRDAVTSARFSPDGTLVVTSSRDHDARVWEASTGRVVHVLRGHFGQVSDADFSPDGAWIVTAGPGSAGLWRTATGQRVLFLYGPRRPLTGASFSPDGLRLLTTSLDGTLRAYRCEVCGTIDSLMTAARSRLARIARGLTPAQRERYLSADTAETGDAGP